MEQRSETKWKKIRKDLDKLGNVLAQLSQALIFIDGDMRSLRKELEDKDIIAGPEPVDPEPVQAKTEDYFKSNPDKDENVSAFAD